MTRFLPVLFTFNPEEHNVHAPIPQHPQAGWSCLKAAAARPQPVDVSQAALRTCLRAVCLLMDDCRFCVSTVATANLAD